MQYINCPPSIIQSNPVLGYARVSTPAQNDKLSLNVQTKNIMDYVYDVLGLSEYIPKIVSEVNRGTENVTFRKMLKDHANSTIIINDITRFSRSVKQGLNYLKQADKNNITLIFLEEQIVRKPNCNVAEIYQKIKERLDFAEKEPEQISKRIVNHYNHCYKNMILMGRIPYGYIACQTDEKDNNGKYITAIKEDRHKIKIIEFIKKCKQGIMTENQFNDAIHDLQDIRDSYEKFCPYDMDPFVHTDSMDMDDQNSRVIRALSDLQIANFLNDCEIYYYNTENKARKWKSVDIKKLADFEHYKDRKAVSRFSKNANLLSINKKLKSLNLNKRPSIRRQARAI
jgi:DNA invertase Pin-like site-specific DNA recombinase